MRRSKVAPAAKRKRRTQEERRNATYRRLIEAAIACIVEVGSSNATMSVIAKRARLTTGAVQHHFSMRDPLFIAVADEFGKKFSERLARPLPRRSSVQSRVDFLLRETWEVFTEPHFVAGIEILMASRRDRKLHDLMLGKVNEITTAMDKRWIEIFSDLDLSARRIKTVRQLAQSALRGFAFRLNFQEQRADLARERDLLCVLLVLALQRREK